MVVHNTRTRSSSSFYLFILVGLALLTVAFIWARLFASTEKSSSELSSSFKTFSSSQYHFSINYPLGWQLQDAPDNSNVVTLASFTPQTEGDGGRFSQSSLQAAPTAALPANFSKIDIVAYDVDAGTTAQTLLNLKTGAVVEGQISDFKLNGQDALKVTVPTASNIVHGNESSLTYTSIFVTSGTHGYIIAGYAEPGLFDQIINSFQIN